MHVAVIAISGQSKILRVSLTIFVSSSLYPFGPSREL